MNRLAKFLLVLAALVALAYGSVLFDHSAEAQSAYPYAKSITQDTTPTQFHLVKVPAGTAVLMAITDVNGYSGICVGNCGNQGTAWIAFAGQVPLIMDATATAGHYVLISSTTAGDGKDSGAATYPQGGGSVVGRVITGCSGPNCKAIVDLFPGESSSNTLYGRCDITVGDASAASALTNAQLGPQKRICGPFPQAATILEVDVAADAGTPNVITGRNIAGTGANLTSSALATAASGGIACSNTGGTTGIDGATTCTGTLQNTAIAKGGYVELVSGTAGGTAKLMTIHILYTVNP